MLRSAEILTTLQRIDTQVDHSIEALGFGQRVKSEAVGWRNDVQGMEWESKDQGMEREREVQGMKWERKDNWAEGNKGLRERERLFVKEDAG